MANMEREPILSARDVEISFSLRGKKLNAIRRCSLDLYQGETLAIVGESGSGKSVFTKSFLGMLDANGSITGGSILFEGKDLAKYKTEKDWMTIRGKKISMVMQDPMTSLNPLKKIGRQIEESIELNQGIKGPEAKKMALEMLKKVGIPDPERRYQQYPHEFSGGMRQRVVIAIAAACHPQILICDEPTTALDVTIQAQILNLIRDLQKELNMTVIYITHDLGVVANQILICDEPTTALDVTIQAQILNLIRDLQKELNMTVIYITHDLGVVANVADRVAVMYAGQIVEYGKVDEIFYDAWHPYTWALLSALPQLGIKGEEVADRVAVMYAGQIVEYGKVDEIFYDAWHPYTWALLSALPQLGIKGEELPTIEGTPPNLFNEIKGDAFAPRNRMALAIDFEEEPPFFDVSPTHKAKTWYLDPRAPKIEQPDSIRKLREKMKGRG